MKHPESAYKTEGGLVYVPRMLSKIRLHLEGELDEAYVPYFGIGMDGRTCTFLKVNYQSVVEKIKGGMSDSEVLQWCFDNGRNPNELDIMLFNSFMIKRGWKDEASPLFEKVLKASGLSDRKDIETFFDYFDVDEGRKS